MQKNKRIKWGIFALVCVMLCMVIVVIADPGTEGDPLISKSYIDNKVIPYLEQFILGRIDDIKSGGTTQTSAPVFKVVEADAGKQIICGAGTELILRMGKATVIATPKGGLADTTAGYDLANGTEMPSNHLLIVPVGDGRGIKTQNKVIVLIKGDYTVK